MLTAGKDIEKESGRQGEFFGHLRTLEFTATRNKKSICVHCTHRTHGTCDELGQETRCHLQLLLSELIIDPESAIGIIQLLGI
jgi:hypothetical protein